MTRRSRSSFDLRDALVTAEALSPKPPPAAPSNLPDYGGLPLVAFGNEATAPSQPPRPVSAPPVAAPAAPAPSTGKLSKPPEPAASAGLMTKLSALVDWLRGDADVSRVIVVDDEGLPLVGSTSGDLGDAESLLAATGSVASAMKRLALATPGTLSPDFEGHVGDGPVLQLIGFSASARAFVVGISRREPFLELDVERVRGAFVRALEGAGSSTPLTPRVGPSGRPGES